MTREIEHERRVALLRQRSILYDVESAIAKQHRRAARQSARLGRVQHLNTNANALGGTNLGEAKKAGGTRCVRARSPLPNEHGTGRDDDERQYADEEVPPPHRVAFQSETVSGKSE